MFGIGVWEIVVIVIVAVVLIRPRDLPKTLRRLGRAYGALVRLKELALQKARELESEINRLETTPDPGGAGAPADETDGLYGRLQEDNKKESADPMENEGRVDTEIRKKRAARQKLSHQGGTKKQ